MKLFSRLFNRTPKSTTIDCPRYLGKGHVDRDDIIRLKQEGKWGTGSCAYCKGTGIVEEEMLSKVAPDATYLTTSISDTEREFIINKTQLEGCPITEHNRLWLENAFLLLLDFFGKENTQQRRILKPHRADFPIAYNGTEEAAYEVMKTVATQMEVPFQSITLTFFALALFSYIRGEESPEWVNYLTPNVKGDFLRSQQFIFDNPELIFQRVSPTRSTGSAL